MKRRWALALPATRAPKSDSERERVTAGDFCQQFSSHLGGTSCQKPTGRLLAKALADGALVLKVDVPALSLTSGVLEVEGKDGVALLDSVLAVGLAGVEGVVDGVESRRRGELVWYGISSVFLVT